MNNPGKVPENHWLGSFKNLEGKKYTASFIWNRRSLNLLENLGSPRKILEFHIKLGVGILAINLIDQKIDGLSRKVHTPSLKSRVVLTRSSKCFLIIDNGWHPQSIQLFTGFSGSHMAQHWTVFKSYTWQRSSSTTVLGFHWWNSATSSKSYPY